MRISFVGGGTDLAAFYRFSPGRVISTAIDKYVYVAINRPPLIKKISARYSTTEMIDHPSKINNDRIREALLDLKIYSNIEIATFADVSANTGLGASSSFAVALMKGLYLAQGKKIDKQEAAEAGCRLEIDLVKEPIGKQDQYAVALGGLNIFQFNPDDSVEVTPVRLDFKKRLNFERHLLVFFTGITRLASSVLAEQKHKTEKNFDTLKQMADSVLDFKELLLREDFKGLGKMLHEGWLKKKVLASNISNPMMDQLYSAALECGAWGGKVLGAGGGGCLMFLSPLDRMSTIRNTLKKLANNYKLDDFNEIPVRFVQSGVEVILNQQYPL